MSNKPLFINKENQSLLLEVLLEQLNINVNDPSNKEYYHNVLYIFETNIKLFLNRTNFHLSMVELNKLFLTQVVSACQKLLPKRIQILEEPYKTEDIHDERQKLLEFEMQKKQQELDFYLKPALPNKIDFSEPKQEDIKTLTIEELIAQRNEPIRIQEYSSMDMKKKVSFEDDNIFSKLKKIDDSTAIDANKYMVQESVPLPTAIQEEIFERKEEKKQLEAVFPVSEQIKSLNQLQNKVDSLESILVKICKHFNIEIDC